MYTLIFIKIQQEVRTPLNVILICYIWNVLREKHIIGGTVNGGTSKH